MCVSRILATMEVPAVKHLLNQVTVAAARELVIMGIVVNMVKLEHLYYCNNLKI
jgi:hypothetical protein